MPSNCDSLSCSARISRRSSPGTTKSGGKVLGSTLSVHAVQRSSRLLNVCSRPADLIHLAALQPDARIAHLSLLADETQQWPLPHNVASMSLMTAQGWAFPLGGASFDHARVTVCGRGGVFGAAAEGGVGGVPAGVGGAGDAGAAVGESDAGRRRAGDGEVGGVEVVGWIGGGGQVHEAGGGGAGLGEDGGAGADGGQWG
ncbi:hypothetical protein B0T18DRAFT_408384 [Schizothecium vesticola]|uniref:Uncharacterized protein n=1 Tax=Schizothecium vesticola TaxID=314040 RepID=A0AA40F2T9_9PEZI|nr:hypothetical protein B0T18DRAFT_408384 [Schizothecium vesticola]